MVEGTTHTDADPRWLQDFAERTKRYWTDARLAALIGQRRPAILPSEAPLLLRSLGLLHRDGSMPPDRVRKYRQINHMVALLQPTLRELMARTDTVRLLDAACGRSYLSTLVAWMFKHRYQYPAEILGVDFSSDLVGVSADRAARIGLTDVFKTFVSPLHTLDVSTAWSTTFGTPASPQGLLALHACDTATDDAILLGVSLGVDVLAVVPCCQAELSSRWAQIHTDSVDAFGPIRGVPHLRRVTAAHVTDSMRVLLLRACGYDANAIEFVPMEHTPKNTLIRATLSGAWNQDAWQEYSELVDATGGAGLGLAERLTKTMVRT